MKDVAKRMEIREVRRKSIGRHFKAGAIDKEPQQIT